MILLIHLYLLVLMSSLLLENRISLYTTNPKNVNHLDYSILNPRFSLPNWLVNKSYVITWVLYIHGNGFDHFHCSSIYGNLCLFFSFIFLFSMPIDPANLLSHTTFSSPPVHSLCSAIFSHLSSVLPHQPIYPSNRVIFLIQLPFSSRGFLILRP